MPDFALIEFLATSALEFFLAPIFFPRSRIPKAAVQTSAEETMNTLELIEPAVSPEADLLQLQLEIARRADELAQSRSGSDDRNCWLEAEKEVLGRIADPALV